MAKRSQPSKAKGKAKTAPARAGRGKSAKTTAVKKGAAKQKTG